MRLLLDTHTVIWWFQGNARLPPRVREAIDRGASAVFVSAVSAFEIALKVRMGKLPEASTLASRFAAMTEEQGFEALSVTMSHGLLAGELPFAHRDPFDRLLIAQALCEDMTLASNERLFDAAGVRRLW